MAAISAAAPGGRRLIAQAARTVVKVGSSSLTSRGRLDPERLRVLVDALARRRSVGQQVVLVSSGAIAAGIAPLRLKARPRDLATQQAAASVGQLLLAERYGALFARHDLSVGQILLTADDLHRRASYRNAVRTMERLLALGVIPIVNENDTVATQEIRFGDNDRLAALVAHLVQADALVLLSDIEGLYTGDPRKAGAELISEVLTTDDLAHVRTGGPGPGSAPGAGPGSASRAESSKASGGGSGSASGAGSGVGTGGMATKIEAATIATEAGIPVLLAAAEQISRALDGVGGTYFAPTGRRTASRLFWLRHATLPNGRLILDDGAVQAVLVRRASLLPAGLTGYAGDFAAGDPVELAGSDGAVVARGLVGFDSQDLPAVLGRSTATLPAELRRVAVHRDDLIVM